MSYEAVSDLKAPVSPISAHSAHPEEQLTQFLARKRSHSQMSQDGLSISDPGHPNNNPDINPLLPPRDGSDEHMHNPESPPLAPDEYASPRASRSFKRGDAPKNSDGKYVCDFSTECVGLTFDRKCEWSKHMDKHDRPYRCPDPDCAKLQGFTYSGGLLRHEREVHGKHGGPKAQLMCPYLDCKRHTGKGFTRKENLNEHVRRVHASKAEPITSPTSGLRRDGVPLGVLASAEEYLSAPVARVFDENILPEELAASVIGGKRKHEDIDGFESPQLMDDMDQLRDEVKRLRTENYLKNERIRSMEMAAAETREEMDRLQTVLHQMQQHLPMGQPAQTMVG